MIQKIIKLISFLLVFSLSSCIINNQNNLQSNTPELIDKKIPTENTNINQTYTSTECINHGGTITINKQSNTCTIDGKLFDLSIQTNNELINHPAIYQEPPAKKNNADLLIDPTISIIALDGTKADEQHPKKDTIGCNDKLVKIKLSGEFTPKKLIHTLLNFKQFDYQVGYYNVFENSPQLMVDNIIIDDYGTTKVYLSGELLTAGTCDTPRIISQIKNTLMQIPNVKEINIYINEQNIKEFLSEKG